MQENVPFWKFTLQRLMEFLVDQRVLFCWADGQCTERLISPGDDISFISNCIAEHGSPSPHSGVVPLRKITTQLPSGEGGWSLPAQIWPADPQPPVQH